jgi:hypothetical protein
MSMSNSLPSRPTLLTTAVLAGTAAQVRPASVSAHAGDADPQAGDATTPTFYLLLVFIMVSLLYGVFPRF